MDIEISERCYDPITLDEDNEQVVIAVTCENCEGEGGYEVDAFDPGSWHGHYTRPVRCSLCDAEGYLMETRDIFDPELLEISALDPKDKAIIAAWVAKVKAQAEAEGCDLDITPPMRKRVW